MTSRCLTGTVPGIILAPMNVCFALPHLSLSTRQPNGSTPSLTDRKRKFSFCCFLMVGMAWAGVSVLAASAADGGDWFDFAPKTETFSSESAIDLRILNEKFAGEHGQIIAKDGHFVHGANGQPVRFWAVNGPPHELTGDALARCLSPLL